MTIPEPFDLEKEIEYLAQILMKGVADPEILREILKTFGRRCQDEAFEEAANVCVTKS